MTFHGKGFDYIIMDDPMQDFLDTIEMVKVDSHVNRWTPKKYVDYDIEGLRQIDDETIRTQRKNRKPV